MALMGLPKGAAISMPRLKTLTLKTGCLCLPKKPPWCLPLQLQPQEEHPPQSQPEQLQPQLWCFLKKPPWCLPPQLQPHGCRRQHGEGRPGHHLAANRTG